MANLKKYNGVLKLFVIFLTFYTLISCSKKTYAVTKIEGKRIPITEQVASSANSELATQIENYITPYRQHIDQDLNNILAYCPETLSKSDGIWQTPIGNLMADVAVERGNFVFKSRENKTIDLCILNHGGIRSILPKGNITTRTAFEIMPFENSLIIVALKGEQIFEMVDYFIATKKAHPLSGITFTIDKNNKPVNILIQGKPINKDTLYYVVTSDYLSNGGDNMDFFKKGIQQYDLDYKLRKAMIDYFIEVDTVAIPKDIRVSVEM